MVIVKDGGDHGDRPRSSALVVVTDGVLPCKEEMPRKLVRGPRAAPAPKQFSARWAHRLSDKKCCTVLTCDTQTGTVDDS